MSDGIHTKGKREGHLNKGEGLLDVCKAHAIHGQRNRRCLRYCNPSSVPELEFT